MNTTAILSKAKIKLITSLANKKYRDEFGMFVAEGHKIVNDLLPFFKCKILIAEEEWLTKNNITTLPYEVIEVKKEDIKKISQLTTPSPVLAVFEKPNYTVNNDPFLSGLCLALDDVQDPGNLGTILRIADWFGIETVFYSKGTADVYNPKTIQATMGAIARVKTVEVNLPDFLSQIPKEVSVYGSFLDGEDIYNETLTNKGVIVMGNEGKGISKNAEQFITKRLYIPNFPKNRATSESLNVAAATAIICAEFRRR